MLKGAKLSFAMETHWTLSSGGEAGDVRRKNAEWRRMIEDLLAGRLEP